MTEASALGSKTAELLTRVIVLRDLQKARVLDLGYGKRVELQELLECGPQALKRSLVILEELEPEVNRLKTKIRAAQSVSERVKGLLDLGEARYMEMKENPEMAIPYEIYYKLLAAEGLIS